MTPSTDRETYEALRKSEQNILQLCRMVNDFAAKLGLGKKVTADDWTEDARKAMNKLKGGAT